jgi:PAS domain S-box-containing protein
MTVTKETNQYVRAMIDSLEDELLVIDQDYRIIEANEAVLRRHGKKRHEVIGQYCYNVSHGLPELCHPPHHECPLKAVWENGRPAHVTHLHLYDVPEGRKTRYLDIIASPIKDSQNRTVAVVELMRDVTETKEMELKIAEAHRNLFALNTISSVVSQSLNLDTILRSALDKTLEIMKVNTGGIMLWDEEKQMLCYRVHQGLSERYVKGACYLPGEGVCGRVAQTGNTVLIEDALKEPHSSALSLIAQDNLRAYACVPLRAKKKILGVLDIGSQEARKFAPEDVRLLESIAAQIAIAVENAKLHQEVQRQDENRGELLGQLFSIQEEERRRIARELHDETTQALASLAANLEAVGTQLPEGAHMVKANLKKLQSLSISILDEIHRLIYELRPSLLDDLGLVSATRWLVENNLKEAGVSVHFSISGQERRLSSKLETTLFRVIQEAVSNIARHANARHANVKLHFGKNGIKVSIKDDGRGFDVHEATSSKVRPRGLGLLGMKERVELFRGVFKIKSAPGDAGTSIDITIPVDSEVEHGQS